MNKEHEIQFIKDSVIYCHTTGQLTWKIDRPSFHFKREQEYKRYLSTNAGNLVKCSIKDKSYLQFKIGYKLYEVHRIAFVLMNGTFPLEQVDHINGNKLNNKWDNLREVPQCINARNRKKQVNNSSGITGVSWHKTKKLWIARVHYEGKEKQIGGYLNINEAIKARVDFIKNVPELGYTHDHGIR